MGARTDCDDDAFRIHVDVSPGDTQDQTFRTLGRIVEEAGTYLTDRGVEEQTARRLELALEELTTNVVRHNPGRTGGVALSLRLLAADGQVCIRMEDTGQPFDPTQMETPDVNEPVATRRLGGLGILFVTKAIDEMRYERDGDRNVSVLRVRYNSAGDAS